MRFSKYEVKCSLCSKKLHNKEKEDGGFLNVRSKYRIHNNNDGIWVCAYNLCKKCFNMIYGDFDKHYVNTDCNILKELPCMYCKENLGNNYYAICRNVNGNYPQDIIMICDKCLREKYPDMVLLKI
jgi:hypothetical protein